MMEERVALVTGGSRGIGRAIAVELSRAGYRVIVTYKENVAAAEETLALIRSEGGQAEAVRFDVADSSESAAAMEDIFSRHREIQVLVNNAGITADGLFMRRAFHDDVGGKLG